MANSNAVKARVQQFQSQGQWRARDIDKYLFNLPIPKFDAANAVHRELACAGAIAETVANGVTVRKREHYLSVRRRIRSALDVHGVASELEELTRRLLG